MDNSIGMCNDERPKDCPLIALPDHHGRLVDTDALITKFFSHFLLTDPDAVRRNDMLADAITEINKFDLILFLEPTVEFVQDGTRNEKIRENREMYSRQIKDLFDKAGMQYHCIGGDYQERFARARELVDSLMCQ